MEFIVMSVNIARGNNLTLQRNTIAPKGGAITISLIITASAVNMQAVGTMVRTIRFPKATFAPTTFKRITSSDGKSATRKPRLDSDTLEYLSRIN